MTTAAGSLSLAQQYLRATLAASASWQAECNVSTAAEAEQRTYHNGLPSPQNDETHTRQELEGYRPYAIVYIAPQQGFSRTVEAVSDNQEYNESGRLFLEIVRNSPDAAGDQPTGPANLDFTNLLGQIIDEMCDLAGLAGYLAFDSIALVEGPEWAPVDLIETQGLWQWAKLLVQF